MYSMHKFLSLIIVLLGLTACQTKEVLKPVSDKEIKGDVVSTVPKEKQIEVSVDVPTNVEQFVVIDEFGRELPLEEDNKVVAEDKTQVMLVNKADDEVVYIGFVSKTSQSPTSRLSNCVEDNKVDETSTAKWIMTNISFPIVHAATGLTYDEYAGSTTAKRTMCDLFTDEDSENIKKIVKNQIKEAGNIARIAFDKTLETITSKITGGIFSDCFTVIDDLFLGEQILDGHPEQDKQNSLIQYNKSVVWNPYVVTEFTKYKPVGVIIKDAKKLDNGKWQLTISAYNSLPVALGLQIAKAGEVVRDDTPITYLKPHGDSYLEIMSRGVSCVGFVENMRDNAHLLYSSNALVSRDYKQHPNIVLELDETYNLIKFQTLYENPRVAVYTILSHLGGITSLVFRVDQLDKEIEKERAENSNQTNQNSDGNNGNQTNQNNDGNQNNADNNGRVKSTIDFLIDFILEDEQALAMLVDLEANAKDISSVIARLAKAWIDQNVQKLLNRLIESGLTKYKSENLGLKAYNLAVDITSQYSSVLRAFKAPKKISPVSIYLPNEESLKATALTPADKATDVPTSLTLSWNPPKYDGGNDLQYTVGLKIAGEERLQDLAIRITEREYKLTNLKPNTTYNWNILTVFKTDGETKASSNSKLYSFTTIAPDNNPPTAPTLTTPTTAATDIAPNTPLKWEASTDADSDPLTYTVLLGTTDPPTKVSSGLTTLSYTPTSQTNNTKYYWQITTSDGKTEVSSPVRSYTIVSVEAKLQWDQTFGGSAWDGAFSVIQTSDGGYALAGRTASKGRGQK